jgi:RNA-binding protein
MTKENKIQALTGKQVRYLRGLGHHLKPMAWLGREGITDNVITSVESVLKAHELIKVKVGNGCPLDRKEASAALAAKTYSAVVQVLGKTFLLFRENPDRDNDQRINLPG